MRGLLWFAIVVAILACLILGCSKKSSADCSKPVSYDLTMTLRSPIWSSRNGVVSNWRSTEFGGKLELNNVIGCIPKFHPFVSGMHALGDWNTIFDAKNELQVGFDYNLGKDYTFFSYWDRHFTKDVDRTFVGITYKTHGLF